MLNPVSALNGAELATGIAQIVELGPRGMITIRGDLSARATTKAVAAVAGVAVPEQRQVALDGRDGLAWMSPDELLLMCEYAQATQTLATLTKKLGTVHALCVNVSDARAVFEVRGPHARDVMAKLAPVDLAPAAFMPGMFRRSRIAQVPAAFWMPQEDVFHVVCFRSVAQYVFDVLSVAAQPGSEVGYF
jgi:sarcosine oxidase subunit gamma